MTVETNCVSPGYIVFIGQLQCCCGWRCNL